MPLVQLSMVSVKPFRTRFETKRELTAQGHKFVTETDTEIIAHLIEQIQQDADSAGLPIPLEVAVRRAVKRLTGALRWVCCRPSSRTRLWSRALVLQ